MDLTRKRYVDVLLSVGVWCGLIVLAPVLRAVGSPDLLVMSNALYFGFSKVCHQLDDRSIHLMGVKLGVCVRCSSIYLSFFVALLVYPYFRSLKSPVVPKLGLLALGVIPMALDAFSNDLGIHASSDLSRFLTGSLAGFI